MRATARLAVAADRASGVTRVAGLRSDPPLALRPTRAAWSARLPRRWIRADDALVVALATAAAGPLGGDELRLEVDVGPGATLVLRSVSASVVLPGVRGERSRMSVDLHVAEGATVVWLPGVTIATQRCNHDAATVVTLDDGARLLTRDVVVLGRHGESAGSLCQSLRVTVVGRPLLHQDLRVGGDTPGWNGPAVAGRHRAVGSVLVVDPVLRDERPARASDHLPDGTAVLDLDGPGALVTAAADDAHTLRGRLDTAVALLAMRATAQNGQDSTR